MIGIFCLFGASAMATVIYNFFLINFECTENITCPTRDVRRWKFCDFIPQLFCRSGFPVAGTHQKYFSKTGCLREVSWKAPKSMWSRIYSRDAILIFIEMTLISNSFDFGSFSRLFGAFQGTSRMTSILWPLTLLKWPLDHHCWLIRKIWWIIRPLKNIGLMSNFDGVIMIHMMSNVMLEQSSSIIQQIICQSIPRQLVFLLQLIWHTTFIQPMVIGSLVRKRVVYKS